MKILYIHPFFKTPQEGGGIRSWYLAKVLVEAGCEVNFISSHTTQKGIKIIDGIRVYYIKISYNNSFGFIKRLWAYGGFVLSARALAKKMDTPDLAYVMTTPLTTGLIATWIKTRHSILL